MGDRDGRGQRPGRAPGRTGATAQSARCWSPVRRARWLRVAGILAAAVGGPVDGQSLGVEFLATKAGYDGVLDTPSGFLAYGELPLLPWAGVRVGFSGRSERHVRTGPTCTGLIPPDAECPVDTMDGRSRLRSLRLGVALSLPLPSPVVPELYGGVMWSRVTSTFIGRETGREIAPVTPDHGTAGFAFAAGVHAPVAGPFWASARAHVELPHFSTCGADAWFAFCEDRRLWSLSIGLRVVP